MPAPPCPSPKHLRAAEGCLSQHVLMHRNPECLKPPVSMTIKVQQFHERGCLIHAHCRREVASLALGSRCLTRAVKSICHREAYLISVYRNPNAFPQVNGSFCRGPSVLRGKAKTQGRDQIELALLPSKGVTLGVREICRNPPPEDSLPKQPIASCKQKDHCPFLPQSCPPDMATPLGGGGGCHIFNVPPVRDPFLSAEDAGEDLACGPHSLREKNSEKSVAEMLRKQKTTPLSTSPVWDLLKKALGREEGRAAGFRCF